MAKSMALEMLRRVLYSSVGSNPTLSEIELNKIGKKILSALLGV